MEVVGAAAGYHIDNRARVATEFSIEIVRDYSKFLRGVRVCGGNTAQPTRHGGIVIVRAIEEEVVVAIALAIDRNTSIIVGGADDTGRKQNQLIGITEDQRQPIYLFLIDDGRERITIAFDCSRCGI